LLINGLCNAAFRQGFFNLFFLTASCGKYPFVTCLFSMSYGGGKRPLILQVVTITAPLSILAADKANG
jgi:hypothetical protein